jgi:predicted molibdopterin-dependent oxidoreductase YjgC
MCSVKILINDREFEAKAAQTIMEAADEAGVAITRLCNHPSLKPSGSCRLCAVEIEGCRGLPAACTTPVADGMSIRTETPKVLDFRREMLRLILQDHPRECLGCPRNGSCELQQLVASVGIDFPYTPPSQERLPPSAGGAYFERDYSLCVHCGRCVRVCHEVRGAKAIVFRENAGRQEVGTPLGRGLAEAGCEFCGSCVDVCPVGALREKLDVGGGEPRRQMLQVCENLANIVMTLYRAEAPRYSKTSICPICTAGCSMDFETAGEHDIIQVRPALDPAGNRGQSCIQGRFLLKSFLQRAKRILKPLVRDGQNFVEEEWSKTLELVSREFKSFGPDEIAVLTNARLSNEDLYLLRRFAREALNTKMVGCITPSGHSLNGEVSFANERRAERPLNLNNMRMSDCVLSIGFNPPATHPIAGVRLREAVMGGTKLVTAGPCETVQARYADIHLPCYPGAESVLLSGLVRLLLDGNQAHPESPELESLWERLSGYSPETVSKVTGAPESGLVEAADLIGGANTLSIFYGTGIFASREPADALRAIHVLMQVRENTGKRDGFVLPAFGCCNSPGELAIASALDSSGREDVLAALASGKVKALYFAAESMGEDALGLIRPWLEKLDFVLIQDVVTPEEKILRSLPVSSVLLPMASVLESGGTFTCGGEKIRPVQPILSAPGEAKPVQWVLGALSRTMGVAGFDYDSTGAVLSEICSKVPFFAQSGSSVNRDPCRLTDWIPIPLTPPTDAPDKEFPFALLMREQLDPYFLGPLLAYETSALFDCPADIEMNPGDLFSMGFSPGETVRVVMREGELEGRLGLNHFLMPKMVAVKDRVLRNAKSGGDGQYAVCAAKIEKR